MHDGGAATAPPARVAQQWSYAASVRRNTLGMTGARPRHTFSVGAMTSALPAITSLAVLVRATGSRSTTRLLRELLRTQTIDGHVSPWLDRAAEVQLSMG